MESLKKTEKTVAFAAAGLVACLAALVLAAWHARWTGALQLTPDLVPMQYNTALNFLATGLALLLSQHKKTLKAGLALAGLSFLFAAVTGLQYVVGESFGIDTLLFEPYVQTRTSHAGRMAPNTVMLFMMTSTAIMCLHLLKMPDWRKNACLILCIVILLVSGIALAGYLAGIEAAYSWWGMSDMAPQTATGFFLSGISLLGQCRHALRDAESGAIRQWMPAYAALAGIVMTLLIAQGILYFDKKFAVQVVNRATQRVAQLVKLELRHVLALRHTQVRWSHDNVKKEAHDWHEKAAGFLADNPAYLSVALYDGKKNLRAAAPSDTESRWQGVAAERLKHAEGKSLYSAGLIELENGKKAALFILPLRAQGKAGGFLATAYDVNSVMPTRLSAHYIKLI